MERFRPSVTGSADDTDLHSSKETRGMSWVSFLRVGAGGRTW
jgi:hypothetical protein